MDDVYLGGSSALKEIAIASTFAPQRSKSKTAALESTRISERATVSRRPRSQSDVTDHTKLWEQAAHGITPGYTQAKRAE